MGYTPAAKFAADIYPNVVKHAAVAAKFNEFTSQLGGPPKTRADASSRAPIAIKDNIATTDLPTSCSSSILTDYLSPFPSTVVTKLSHNYVTTSKTNMDEFGMGSHSINSAFGSVQNPKASGHSAGGSSGGSAVAVASGEYVAALGTDTGGSVRLPAAYTGVTGFKPSYGRISRWGVVAYANSLDTVGILANSPVTAREVFDNAQSHDLKDPTCVTSTSAERMRKVVAKHSFIDNSGNLKKLRIGVPSEYNIDSLTPEVKKRWRNTLDAMRAEGHTLVPISLPTTRHALSAYYIIAAAEASSNLAKYDLVRYGPSSARKDGADNPNGILYAQSRGDNFGEEVRRRILLGSFALSASAMDNYFLQAQKVRALVQRDFDRVFACPNPLHPDRQFDLSDMNEDEVEMMNKLGPAQVDVIIVPTAPSTPPTLEEVENKGETEGWANDVFTVPASLAGLPACSVPIGRSGSLVGMQVIGQYFCDEGVLAVADEVLRVSKKKAEMKTEMKTMAGKDHIFKETGHHPAECSDKTRAAYCHICKQFGHYGAQCPNKVTYCHICKQFGHYAAQCSGRQRMK